SRRGTCGWITSFLRKNSNGNARPSSDGSVEPLPFSSLGTRRKIVNLTVAHTLSGSAAFVSLSSANDFDLRSRAVPAFGLALREGAARAATAGRPCETCVSLARADQRRSV